MRKSLMPDNRRGEKVFPREFLSTIKREAELIPGIKVRMQNNIMFVRQEEGSVLGMEFFESFVKQLQGLAYHERESNRESLIVTRINASTVEVRQAYQTKMFLTNLIFKASVSSIGFMALFMLNRFENLKYFKQLRHVLEEQKSLSSVNVVRFRKPTSLGISLAQSKRRGQMSSHNKSSVNCFATCYPPSKRKLLQVKGPTEVVGISISGSPSRSDYLFSIYQKHNH